MTDVKLQDFRLLIRAADHDRDEIIANIDIAEISGFEDDLRDAQVALDRFEDRKSIDVDDRLESTSGIEALGSQKGAERIISDFRYYLKLPDNSQGK